MTESTITEILRQSYDPDAWAFLPQVRSKTGFGVSRVHVRTADAVAFSLWPSRGLEIHGFEIKCSRSDFMAELRHIDKWKPVGQYCDYWWIVAPRGILSRDMVPDPWGLRVVHGAKVRTLKTALPLPGTKKDELPRSFVASVMRSLQDSKYGRTSAWDILRESIRAEEMKKAEKRQQLKVEGQARGG